MIKKEIKMLAVIFAVIIGLVILFQNTTVVNLDILFWRVSMSRIILLLAGLLLGLVIGYMLGKKRF